MQYLDIDPLETAIFYGIIEYAHPSDLDKGIITQEVKNRVEEDIRILEVDLGDPTTLPVIPYKTVPTIVPSQESGREFVTALDLYRSEQQHSRSLVLPNEIWYNIGQQLQSQNDNFTLSRLQETGVATPKIPIEKLSKRRVTLKEDELSRNIVDMIKSTQGITLPLTKDPVVQEKINAIQHVIQNPDKEWTTRTGKRISWRILRRITIDSDTYKIIRYPHSNDYEWCTVNYIITKKLPQEDLDESDTPYLDAGSAYIAVEREDDEIYVKISIYAVQEERLRRRLTSEVINRLTGLITFAYKES